MTTTSILLRQADRQGLSVIWANSAYRFTPTGCERTPADWSGPFDNIEVCARTAIAQGELRARIHRLFLASRRIDDVLADLRRQIILNAAGRTARGRCYLPPRRQHVHSSTIRKRKDMSHDPSTRAKIRDCLREAFRERLDYHAMLADFTEGAERNEHLASVDFFQNMLDRGAAMRAAEVRH